MSMEQHGMDSWASGFASAIKPLFNAFAYPLTGWAIDHFSLCPANVSNLMSIGNGLVFLVWPVILSKAQRMYLYKYVRIGLNCYGWLNINDRVQMEIILHMLREWYV